MLNDFSWNMTGYMQNILLIHFGGHPLCNETHLPAGTGAASGRQSE